MKIQSWLLICLQVNDILKLGKDLLQLQQLLKDLEEFEKITKQLQNPATTLSDVRAIFDATIEQYPLLNFYLEANAKIVHSPAFESGIVKVLDEELDQLSEKERNSISCFTEVTNNSNNNLAMDDNLSLVQRALKNKKRKVIYNEYSSLNYVPPTSNIVERLFSNARLILTDYRKSMSPYTLECVMFLKFNRNYWDLDLVAKIVEK